MTDLATIAVRFALYLDLMALFGLAAFGLYALTADERERAIRLRPWLATTSTVGLALSALSLTLMGARMTDTSLLEVDYETLGLILAEPSMGWPFMARFAGLAAATALVLAARGQALQLGAAAWGGGLALATLAWTGHGAMDEGGIGWVHLAADILHLGAAGVWVGAFLGLGLLLMRVSAASDTAHLLLSLRALQGFATVGAIVVGTIILTGLINAWLLVGPANLAALPESRYGLLLILKLILFGAMLGLAAVNRFRLTPAFASAIEAGDQDRATSLLRRSVAIEAVCAVVILAVVAWMGTLSPPMSAM